MFDQLFTKLSAVVHHRAAPYAAERERFLAHCAQQGYLRTSLKRLAATLLVAAYDLHSHGGLPACPQDLEAAADRVLQLRADLRRPGVAETYRALFVRVATQWLLFADALRVPAAPPRHFAGLLEDFAQWMTQERGLSPHTIQNRRWHVERFLAWLDERRRPVAELQLRDVDTYFGALHAKGLARVTIKIHAKWCSRVPAPCRAAGVVSAGPCRHGVRSAHLPAP
jgi:integrase/recombinase XerD